MPQILKMQISINLESIEKDITECSEHLNYLKKIANLNRDLTGFVAEYKLNGKSLLDLDITNAHCVATIAQLEMSLILKSLYHSKQELEKKHILKNGILIIYEVIKSLDKFNKSLNHYSHQNNELNYEFKKYNDEIRTFKKSIDIDKEIKNIRNNIAGHINIDFVEYSNFIESVKIERTINYLIAFRMIITRLNDYLFKCIIAEN